MSKTIVCDKCKKISNIFGSVRFIERDINLDYIFCEECKTKLAVNIENSRKDAIKLFMQPERSKREDSIPEWGSNASLNYDEWEKRCGALNTMET